MTATTTKRTTNQRRGAVSKGEKVALMGKILSYVREHKTKSLGMSLMAICLLVTIVVPVAVFDLSQDIPSSFCFVMVTLLLVSGVVFLRGR